VSLLYVTRDRYTDPIDKCPDCTQVDPKYVELSILIRNRLSLDSVQTRTMVESCRTASLPSTLLSMLDYVQSYQTR
jgi:hypothetical protein